MRYWRNQPASAQTKEMLKYKVIRRAGELFKLSGALTEELANRAGLSMGYYIDAKAGMAPPKEGGFNTEFSSEIFPYADRYALNKTDFVTHLNMVFLKYPGKICELCQYTSVSERMLHHIRGGKYLRKEAILSLLIILGQSLENIQTILKTAGFFLSKSLPSDVVIMWVLRNNKLKATELLLRINEELWFLELPLLMTREKIQN